jgi:hypothetical protein
MSYKVTFRDRSEIILPDEAGLALKDHWLRLKKTGEHRNRRGWLSLKPDRIHS